MPYRTTRRITSIELSALRSNASLAKAMRPVAICDTTATTAIGRSAMIGLRKISSSRVRINKMVAMPTMTKASAVDSCWSRLCGTDPVVPAFRSVPATNGLSSARSSLALSRISVPNGSASLARLTIAVCTSLLSEGGAATMGPNWAMSMLFSDWAICSTSAESAAVSGSPSERSNTMIAPMSVRFGNAVVWTSIALIDS